MPSSPPKICSWPGCGKTTHNRFCAEHAAEAEKARRQRADANRCVVKKKLYGGKWPKAREGYLRKHPLCVICQKHGRITAATVVDHIIPHNGDMKLFWDRNNWQPLCKLCHDSYKQRFEKSGNTQCGCDVFGYPLEA